MKQVLVFAFWAIMVLLSPSPSWADQPKDIASQAAHCWAVPNGIKGPSNAIFDVTLDGKGRVTAATIIEYTFVGRNQHEFISSATVALQRCGPYHSFSRTVRVVMDPRMLFDGNLANDLFK